MSRACAALVVALGLLQLAAGSIYGIEYKEDANGVISTRWLNYRSKSRVLEELPVRLDGDSGYKNWPQTTIGYSTFDPVARVYYVMSNDFKMVPFEMKKGQYKPEKLLVLKHPIASIQFDAMHDSTDGGDTNVGQILGMQYSPETNEHQIVAVNTLNNQTKTIYTFVATKYRMLLRLAAFSSISFEYYCLTTDYEKTSDMTMHAVHTEWGNVTYSRKFPASAMSTMHYHESSNLLYGIYQKQVPERGYVSILWVIDPISKVFHELHTWEDPNEQLNLHIGAVDPVKSVYLAQVINYTDPSARTSLVYHVDLNKGDRYDRKPAYPIKLDESQYGRTPYIDFFYPGLVPSILAAKFTDQGNAFTLEFDMPTNKASMLSRDVCDSIFEYETVVKLGGETNPALCSWSESGNMLTVSTSFQATFMPGELATMRSKRIQAADAVGTQLFLDGTVKILSADSPKRPDAVLNGPVMLSACDTLKLDASASRSADGRNILSYNWRFDGWDGATPTIARQNTINASVALSKTGGLTDLNIAAPHEKRSVYKFSLTVVQQIGQGKNSRGQDFINNISLTAEYRINILSEPVPQVFVLGDPVQVATRPISTVVSGFALLSKCVTDERQKQIAFKWVLESVYLPAETDGSGVKSYYPDTDFPKRPSMIFALDEVSSNSKKLTVEAGSMTPYFFYKFGLTGFSVYKPSLFGKNSVVIKCDPTDIVPKMLGGEFRTASKRKIDRQLDSDGTYYPIDASLSIDPDDVEDLMGVKLFEWSCLVSTATTIAERTCRDSLGSDKFFKTKTGAPHISKVVTTVVDLNDVMTRWFMSNSSAIVYTTFETNGTYVISLAVAKRTNTGTDGMYRIKTAAETMTIEVTYADLPEVTIQPLKKSKYNPTSQVTIEAFVDSNIIPFTYEWTEISGTFDAFPTSEAVVTARTGVMNVGSSADLAIAPACNADFECTLKPAQTLLFMLSAWTAKSLAAGNVAYGKISVTVNEPPSGGTLFITPSVGTQLETDFSLEMSNWNDDDVPLIYSFFYLKEQRGVMRRKYLLSDSPTPTSDQFLPKGIDVVVGVEGEEGYEVKKNHLSIVGMVKDKFMAAAYAVQSITVNPMEIAPEDVTNQIGDFVNSEISDMANSGNTDGVKSTMLTVSSLLNEAGPAKIGLLAATSEKGRLLGMSADEEARLALRDNMMKFVSDSVLSTRQTSESVSGDSQCLGGLINLCDQVTAGALDTTLRCMKDLFRQSSAFEEGLGYDSVLDYFDLSDKFAACSDMGQEIKMADSSTSEGSALLAMGELSTEGMAFVSPQSRPFAASEAESKARNLKASNQSDEVMKSIIGVCQTQSKGHVKDQGSVGVSSESYSCNTKKYSAKNAGGDLQSVKGVDGEEVIGVDLGMAIMGDSTDTKTAYCGTFVNAKVSPIMNSEGKSNDSTASTAVIEMSYCDNGTLLDVKNLSDPVKLRMKSTVKEKAQAKAATEGVLLSTYVDAKPVVSSCEFFNRTSGNWSGGGCIAKFLTENYTECWCNHLTEFSTFKPKYNAVDPVNDASLITTINWTNNAALYTLLVVYAIWGFFMAWAYYQEKRDFTRRQILESFGCSEIDEPTQIFTDRVQVMQARMKKSFQEDHRWASAFYVKYDDPYDRYMRLTLCLNIVMLTASVGTLFYGVEQDTAQENMWWSRVVVGVMSSFFAILPLIFIHYAFKKAGNYQLLRQKEADMLSRPDWLSKSTSGAADAKMVAVAKAARLKKRAAQEGEDPDDPDSIVNFDDDDDDDEVVSTGFKYPYVGMAHVSAHLLNLFCTYIIILYGLRFRKDQSSNWLASMFFSVFQDLFINGPAQIFFKGFRAMFMVDLAIPGFTD